MAIPTDSNWAYFIVTPDPNVHGNIALREGIPGFYIKFGDGSPEHRYQTCNPSFHYEINKRCPADRLLGFFRKRNLQYDWNAKERQIPRGDTCQAGKFLQQRYLHITSYESGNTEWYWLGLDSTQDNPIITIDTLRNHLCAVLGAFPDHDMWDDSVSGFGDQSPLGEIWAELNDSRKYRISPATPKPQSGVDRIAQDYSRLSSHPEVPQFGGAPFFSSHVPQ